MGILRGCNLPDDLFYFVEKHIWARPIGGDIIRVGMDAVAGKLSGGKLNAVTIKLKAIGSEILKGKSVATVESSKYVGPVPSPVTGVLERANDKLAADPNLVIRDPYGEGWIVEMKASRWDEEKAGLLTGEAGLAQYLSRLVAENISCG
jgi:glycine cleavage system H protein